MACRVILICLANIFSRAKDVDPDSQKYLEDWYEFWDHIAEVRPCDCKLVTNMFTIMFDEHSLRWKCISQEDSTTTSVTVTLICDALNDNFIRSSTISGWNRHTINS